MDIVKQIEEALNNIDSEDEHKKGNAYVRTEIHRIEWLTHQQSIISQQAEEIERTRQALVDSTYIIDKLISDYPTDLWTHEEEKEWKSQGIEQIKENKSVLEGESPC